MPQANLLKRLRNSKGFFQSDHPENRRLTPRWRCGIYVGVLLLSGCVLFNFFRGDLLGYEEDGGLVYYTIVDNIQRISKLDFSNWRDRRMFYPRKDTFAYTDHFYLHSLIGFPAYQITGNPFDTYKFIFIVQLLIAIFGFYLLAQEFTDDLWAITLAGIYFCFLPSFIYKHPHINFYGFIPWILFAVVRLIKTEKFRFLFLSFLFFFLQASVSLHMQLFMFIFAGFLLLGIVIHLAIERRLKRFLTPRYIVAYFAGCLLVITLLFLITKPYLDFTRNTGQTRSIRVISSFSPDALLTYFVPYRGGILYKYLLPGLDNIPRPRTGSYCFLGASAILLLLVTVVELIRTRLKRLSYSAFHHLLVFLFFLILCCWVLSLGPELYIMNKSTGVILPYRLLYDTSFIFRGIRATGRLAILMAAPLALLILLWSDKIRRSELSRQMKKAITIGFAVLLFLDVFTLREFQPYESILRKQYIYKKVENLTEDVMLELPTGAISVEGERRNWQRDSAYVFFHMFHRKWLVNGYSGYIPREPVRLIGQLFYASNLPRLFPEVVKKSGIGIILVHKYRLQRLERPIYRRFIRRLRRHYSVVYEDGNFLLIQIIHGDSDPALS